MTFLLSFKECLTKTGAKPSVLKNKAFCLALVKIVVSYTLKRNEENLISLCQCANKPILYLALQQKPTVYWLCLAKAAFRKKKDSEYVINAVVQKHFLRANQHW
ncbi:MAG TPA: hypothetical protein VK032_03335 [Burkholderiaceae bacterium]|nr:hypothetical protein [Burkholderiaceae bacterium]